MNGVQTRNPDLSGSQQAQKKSHYLIGCTESQQKDSGHTATGDLVPRR